ncbi:MAG: hypothetical protein Rhirs2KO_09890 [Rhizobiaceae bacterium]
MIRKLLATTAVVALMSGGAFADDHAKKAEMDAGVGVMIFSAEPADEMQSENGYFTAMPGQILASTLIGQSVYASSSEDAERVGEVDDVLLSQNGTAEAVVLGVGGFLGIGEKDVAIDFERLTWVEREDGERWLTASLTKEELEAAPAFNRADMMSDEQASRDVMRETETADAEQPADEVEKTEDVAAAEKADELTEKPDEMAAAEKPAMDSNTTASIRDSLVSVQSQTLSAEKLIGARVYSNGDEDIGEIGDVLVTADGKLDAYVIDVGGFLGIGEKRVALDGTELEILRDDGGSLYVYTNFTEEQLENQPAYTEEAYEANEEGIVLR